jgi:hypothetical protein
VLLPNCLVCCFDGAISFQCKALISNPTSRRLSVKLRDEHVCYKSMRYKFLLDDGETKTTRWWTWSKFLGKLLY